MREVLLVEPGYRNKYPPLGLMKISAYHKRRGDRVTFVKGRSPALRERRWDRVYVATLFTFFWRETVDTIKYYGRSVDSPSDVYVGGILASLLGDELRSQLPVTVITGLLDKPGMLDPDSRIVVDHLIPDYNMLADTDYEYAVSDAYIGYATRGCPNSCRFCAVPSLEPEFVDYMPLRSQVLGIEAVYGQKRDLLLLDNNVLASTQFERIVHDIRELGFEKGSRYEGRERRVDFNQGIDLRRITKAKIKLLSSISLKPVRFAFDKSSYAKRYQNAVRMAVDVGLRKHSTYVLYNYKDTPEDFYRRLQKSIELNEELDSQVSSFPMRFIPLTDKKRGYVGPNWSKRLLRGLQCILLATRGMVSPRREFFEAAFGRTADEFRRIALMPEPYIIYRRDHESNGASDWLKLYRGMGKNQRKQFIAVVSKGRVTDADIPRRSSPRVRELLQHYIGAERRKNVK